MKRALKNEEFIKLKVEMNDVENLDKSTEVYVLENMVEGYTIISYRLYIE